MVMRATAADPADEQVCYETGLRSLTARWHGRKELRSKLARKGFVPGVVETVLVRLEEEGWIDDHRFAVAFAGSRLRKHIGPARVVRELRQRGIDESVASSAIAEAAVDSEDPEEHLGILCRKKLRLLRARPGAEPEEVRKKLISFLLNQGYDYGEASAVVESELRLRQKD
jgi:regulatory protein